MRTLHLRKSAGIYSGIDADGMYLASCQGLRAAKEGIRYGRVFMSQLQNSRDTAVAFLMGYSDPMPFMPPIPTLGNTRIFRQIEEARTADVVGMQLSAFEALFVCHDTDTITRWSHMAGAGIEHIFARMHDDETALAWGHSPVMQLALYYFVMAEPIAERTGMLHAWKNFGPLEGIVLTHDGENLHIGTTIGADQFLKV